MVKIKIYSTGTCGYCKAEKTFLDEHKITYEEARADLDPRALEELQKLSGQLGVPFTIITKEDGSKENILGFDQQKLSKALGI